MYVPFRRIYRAFAELDGVTDEECERYVRRARLKMGRSAAVVPVVGAALAAAAAGVAAGRACVNWFGGAAFGARAGTTVGVVVGAGLLAGGVAGLLARDMVLLRAVRAEINRARCRKCRQSLHGLPVRTIGTHPGPTDSFVRCPECGREWCLFDLGLRAEDLIPWEQRVIPPDFAKKRRRAAWESRW